MVVCGACGDAVAADGRCSTCGWPEPSVKPPRPEQDEDVALLEEVGHALTAHAAMSGCAASGRTRNSRSMGDSVVLRSRLRKQASLLRDRISERESLVPGLRTALGDVEHALDLVQRPLAEQRDWIVSARLPRDLNCAMVARRLVEGYTQGELLPQASEDAVLIASELAANALRHGRGTITLTVQRSAGRLRIEVCDEGNPEGIRVIPKEEHGSCGRGLWIVDQVALDWGFGTDESRVWAELPVHR